MNTLAPSIYFGTSEFAVSVLTTLSRLDLSPSLVITNPDRPRGRGLVEMETPVSAWCRDANIPVIKPMRLDADLIKKELTYRGHKLPPNYFLVAAYGGILPRSVLNIPKHGCINIHPSLLPRHRGPSPIHATLLEGDTGTGVTIMLMDEKVDHGPILAMERIPLPSPRPRRKLEATLGDLGGTLAAQSIPLWLNGKITPAPQNEDSATFTKKISKGNGKISLDDDPQKNYRAFLAYDGWPGTFFLIERAGKPFRVKIIEASFQSGRFEITTVRPEGGTDISWNDFIRGYGDPRTSTE